MIAFGGLGTARPGEARQTRRGMARTGVEMHEPPGFSSTGGLHFAALQTFGAAGNVIREVERLSQDLARSAERLEELHDLELNLTVFDVEEHGKHDPVALVFQLHRPLADDVEEWLKLQEEPTALDPLPEFRVSLT